MDPLQNIPDLIAYMRSLSKPRVLELGTKQSIPGRPTHHKDWAPNATWTLADLEPGADVDVTADAHRLEETFPEQSFDVVISCSTFEHLQRPWIAAASIAKVLKPGGVVFIMTHQTFPIHSFPNDYWRFSTDALRTILGDAGIEPLSSWYELPSHVFSIPTTFWPTRELKECVARFLMPSYLAVSALGRKRQS